jgi:predicted NBD/HSP70 family sugar kinase
MLIETLDPIAHNRAGSLESTHKNEAWRHQDGVLMISDKSSLTPEQQSLLRALFIHGAATQQFLTRTSHLGRSSVSDALQNLVDREIVAQAGLKSSGVGRPATLYEIGQSAAFAVGLSVDQDHSTVCIVDSHKNIVDRQTLALAGRRIGENPREGARLVAAAIRQCIDASSFAERTIGIGVALPGLVNTDEGLWIHDLWHNTFQPIRFQELMFAELSIPVLLEDKARATSLAHMADYETLHDGHAIVLYLGEGVGSSIIRDGVLLRGANGVAGEIGHISARGASHLCTCGNVGCFETLISSEGILRSLETRLDRGVFSRLQSKQAKEYRGLSLDAVKEAADAGDSFVESCLIEVGDRIGEACSVLIKFWNPKLVLVSGPVSTLWRHFEARVLGKVRQEVRTDMKGTVQVEFASYATSDEARGAAYLSLAAHWMGNTDLQEVDPVPVTDRTEMQSN